MNTFRFIVILCAVAVLTAACGSNEPTFPNTNPPIDDGGKSSESVESIIKNNVSTYVTYSDFAWNISITTSLDIVYTNHTIRYGLEYGYGAYSFKPYTDDFKNDSRSMYFKYREYPSSSNTTYSWRTPLYVDNPYSKPQFYWYSYIDIKENLTKTYNMNDADVKSLYNECLKSLRDNESSALNSYQGRIFAEIDGKKYYIREYNKNYHN